MARTNPLGLKSRAAARLISSFDDDETGCLINVEAEEKAGKNHFAFGAPKPLLCIAGDRKVKPVARKFKGVHAVAFPWELPEKARKSRPGDYENKVASILRPIWNEAEELYFDALRSSKIRSIVVDTGDWAWNTIRLAKFGRLDKVPPMLYTQVNAVMSRMLLAAQGTNKHVIWLHRLGEKWADKKDNKGRMVSYNTGEMKRMGFKGVGFDVEANIRLTRNGSRFRATVIDNAFDADCNGMVFKGRNCDYSVVMSTLTGTDRDLWR